ncbi:MAG: hypothetical protein MN733_43300 [Nitrososphaera sp.]|nr:hypothetical protein [Nitrososphaera sp.]
MMTISAKQLKPGDVFGNGSGKWYTLMSVRMGSDGRIRIKAKELGEARIFEFGIDQQIVIRTMKDASWHKQ